MNRERPFLTTATWSCRAPATYQQYLRLHTLQAANGRISNATAGLPIFEHYAFDLAGR